jgi:hypothetical protein
MVATAEAVAAWVVAGSEHTRQSGSSGGALCRICRGVLEARERNCDRQCRSL